MAIQRRHGFTLIELLVVIAIIGILAAMLFPVFARARESARKIQCLANVKNIAMAMQMYLTDYDMFFPREHTPEAEAFFSTEPGKSGSGDHPDCNHKQHANPYLRFALILDEYIKNRDVWRCPSANVTKYATWIVNPYGPGGGGNWLRYLEATQGSWGRLDDPRCSGGPCCVAWPPGWGGTATDTVKDGVQGSEGSNAFGMSISWASSLYELKTSQIDDPAWYVVCGDGGLQEEMWAPTLLAFPGICRTDCGPHDDSGPCTPCAGCCSGDWSNCSWTRDCGLDVTLKLKIFTDQEVGKQYARHLGGSNVGFADGHAKWMSAYSILAESPSHYGDNSSAHLEGLGCTCLK
jgi:prepilin-type N-terminal cleavage/methylation domain-containing protein/prepilin-type processing-associated H-X9-DG protein